MPEPDIDIKLTVVNNLRQQVAAERQRLRDMRNAKIFSLKLEGHSNVKIARRFGISESTVRRVTK